MPDGRDVKGYRRENVVIDDPFLDDPDIAALVSYRQQARVVHLTAEAITRINRRIRSDGACRGGEAPRRVDAGPAPASTDGGGRARLS
jgi:hypothetical protein